MGIWGPKLYQDDMAEDIKEEYEELIRENKNNKEAIEQICFMYKEEIEDSDERPVFWMVLADVLCKYKNLTNYVKEKALKEIESGENLERWKNESSEEDYKVRKKELERLRKKLDMYKDEKTDKTEKKSKSRSMIKTQNYKDNEWKIGDTYAYKIENSKYEGNYLILRKVKDYEEYSNTRYQSAIVYVQITYDKKIPTNEEEINELDYIITSNVGNVKYEYKVSLYQIPRKISDKLIYLGNFKNIKTPNDEYINKKRDGGWLESFKRIEYLITRMLDLGTNKNPIYRNINPRNMSDSYIRFLMKVRYYKEKLNIIPPENAIVKDDSLLYIAFVDSLMIGGIVENPVIMKVKDMKEEAYKRIEELKKVINKQNETQEKKNEKINILEDLRKRIEVYKDNWL